MLVLSYVHELSNVVQCHAYIHTLRWKDRPLQCPRCQSQDIDPWGTYHSRVQTLLVQRLPAHL
jgi:primosomal protein N'